VCDHLKVSKPLRLLSGGIKNLICGVTSVLHHNPYHPIFDTGFPVRVVRRFGWSHSLAFSQDLAGDWTRTPPKAPFLIHACEGTDNGAAGEVYRLDAAGTLGPATVLVHGVALTAAGDLVDELEIARRYVTVERLYAMVTDIAARVLRLEGGEGTISDGGTGDLVIVRDIGASPAEALPSLHPEAVIVGGRVKLISPFLAQSLPSSCTEHLQPLRIEGRGRWLIDCEVRMLMDGCHRVFGDRFRLAGKAVAA
jgi:Amidohydrolase family